MLHTSHVYPPGLTPISQEHDTYRLTVSFNFAGLYGASASSCTPEQASTCCCNVYVAWLEVQITMMGIATLTSGQAQWRELQKEGLNPLVLARQVSPHTTFSLELIDHRGP